MQKDLQMVVKQKRIEQVRFYCFGCSTRTDYPLSELQPAQKFHREAEVVISLVEVGGEVD